VTPAVPNEIARIAQQVQDLARGLGFDLVGIARAQPSANREYFRRWLDAGRAGEMHYLAERFEQRVDPGAYLPGARSAVCVAVNYHVLLPEVAVDPAGRIARYALGLDYHDWVKPRLYAIADWLREAIPGCRTVCGVDTAPILERELAARAGIGWVGKNTLVINERIGSWLLLGEVLTTAELPIDEPAIDRCGTCARCIEACPTGAITAPQQLDATRCISYLTIEHRGQIDPSLRPMIGDWIYGCDVCQDVCPWNGRAPVAELAELQPRIPPRIALDETADWTAEDFNRTFRRTAVKRIRLPILQRNAVIAKENGESRR
jgi:epoxyqueuosine reductase